MGVLNVERTQSNSVRCHVYLSTDVQERSWSLLKSGFSQEPNNRRRIISLWTLIETLIKTNKQKKKTSKIVPQWSDTLKERFFGALDTKTKLGFGHAHCCCESHSTPVGPPPSSFCSSSLLTSIHLPSHSFSSLIPHSATWGQFQTFTSFFFLLFPRLLLLAFTKLWWKGKDGPSALWFVHWA